MIADVGISALVGFGILAILTPVPTHVGRLMVGVQKEKMEKVNFSTDLFVLWSLMR